MLRARNLPRLGWTIAIAVAFLSGFAIYLGRFLRWRSIDIFQQPLGLAADILTRAIDPLHHPRAWGVTLTFGFLFSIGYMLINFSFSQHRTKIRTRYIENTSIKS